MKPPNQALAQKEKFNNTISLKSKETPHLKNISSEKIITKH